MDRAPRIRWGIRAATVLLTATLGACGMPGLEDGSAEPPVTAPPANIVDELVRNTVQATGAGAPYEVLEIREGALDDLRGLTPEAEAAGSVIPYATGRRSLDRRVWRVRLIATDTSAPCPGDPCERPKVYIQAFLDTATKGVIAVVTGPVPSGLVSPSP